MIEDLLNPLGINAEMTKIYLALLETGSITAGDLAKRLGMPRPSLYGHLEKLHGVGMVAQSVNASGVKTFTAEPPEKISLLFNQKIEYLNDAREHYSNAVTSLQQQFPTTLLRPKFQLFEGEEGVRHVLKDMLLYRNMQTSALWPMATMLKALSPEFFRYFNKERIRNALYTRALWPSNQVVNVAEHPYLGIGKAFQREIRIAPKAIDFSMGYWIYGNKAAFISSQKEQFGFIIESAELVAMLLAQFNVLWEISTPLQVDEKTTADFLLEI